MIPTAPAVRRAATVLRVADSVLAATYTRPDTLFVAGEGSWLEDAEGDRFLDFTSGICVNALGHAAPAVTDALRAGARGLLHTSNLFHTEPAVELAAALVRLSFADRVFYCNSGAEANEAAIKFARLRGGEGRRTIVSFTGSFHGRTLGTLAATDKPEYQAPFTPLAGGFTIAPWNDENAFGILDKSTAAAIVEPVQGESGVRVPEESWLRALRRRCDEVGACLVFDEVQTGVGRCGTLWAHESFGVTPDLMTLAKPLAGGLPIGAVLMTEPVADAIRPGCHGTTFGGGPFVTTVALRVLSTIADRDFLDGVRARGERLRERLAAVSSPLVQEIRGRGLLLGARVERAADVRAAAFAERLLLAPAGDGVLRFVPRLDLPDREIDEAVDRFERALARVEDGP